MRKFFAFMTGTLCGAIVGGAISLLLAPMSGQSMQEELAVRFDKLKADIEASVAEQEKRLRAEFERMKEGSE